MQLFDFSYEFPSTIEEIDAFSGVEFEVFLFEYFQAKNCNPRLTDDSNDKGIDLMIHLPQENMTKKIGIQAKRWKGSIGAVEIRKMLDGKGHYNLDELWIITTSRLTSSAITTAKNNRIQILKREHVISFLEDLKSMENIRFKKPKKAVESREEESSYDNLLLFEMLRKLRKDLAKKHKLYPVYHVYNNVMLEDIIKKMPKTLEALKEVQGFGEKKIDMFGQDVVTCIKRYNDNKELNDRVEALIKLRTRIAKFNKIDKDEDAFSNEALITIAEKLPTTIEDLKEIRGIEEDKIEIFGRYLITKIKTMFIDSKKT